MLAEIKKNKPAPVELPSLSFTAEEQNKTERFLELLHSIGGRGVVVNSWNDVQGFLEQKSLENVEAVNGISILSSYNIQSYSGKEGSELEKVYTVLLEGELGVAENSAVWVKESKMVNRLLPLICQELVLVIKEETIVANMHEAYSKIKVNEDGYGVFIAGPSKTADIEQSLVIGAHGPLSLQVFILKSGIAS
ncbi:MAG: lactate utilization protein B/C [Chitinophagaceae bacterium]|nr:MAG: lactate utilization protein B/C [Chitinophagaceae bacterium]